MASLINCPHCGVRPREEFTIRGDAGPVRPAPDADFGAWDAYVHLRDNVRGPMAEHWQHSGGCRRWLVVERDTFTHEVFAVVDAADYTRVPVAKPARARKAANPAGRRGGA
ncbi:sarcosine oxidase subunit delta [uncultured Hoeflea sp.]|uniref:sarcosine oxidase subunit delta n=1 Tax=uncultured Hoeflea sp. TaxID=538666 RepID=UPI0026136865|nr:sarcosine oxidase subunit delta [uncultured Hoeflea sp.]